MWDVNRETRTAESEHRSSSRRRQFLKTAAVAGLGTTMAGSAEAAPIGPPDGPREDFHVFLLFGQSNMEGQGEVAPKDEETTPQVRVLQDKTCSNLDREYGNWYEAEPPLNRCWAGIGPGDYFGKTMAAAIPDDETIGLVPAAVSGARIEVFQKGAPIGAGDYSVPRDFPGGYAWLLDLAKRAQEDGVVDGILFHQGESNAGQESWTEKVAGVVSNLKSDLGIGDVPFLAGEMLYAEQGGQTAFHNEEVNELPNVIPNAHVVSAEGLPGQDDYHFSAEGYREFGRRYAETMLDVTDLGEPAETPTPRSTTLPEPDPPGPVGDSSEPPNDPDDDGLYEDVNGNGRQDIADAVDLFQNRRDMDHRFFDFNDNYDVDIGDAAKLFLENTG